MGKKLLKYFSRLEFAPNYYINFVSQEINLLQNVIYYEKPQFCINKNVESNYFAHFLPLKD